MKTLNVAKFEGTFYLPKLIYIFEYCYIFDCLSIGLKSNALKPDLLIFDNSFNLMLKAYT